MLRIDEYFVLFASGLALFMGASAFVRRLSLRSILYALFLIFTAYLQSISALITSKEIYTYHYLIFSQVPFGFSLSPLLYHYMLTFTNNKKRFSLFDYLHFIPAFILCIIAARIYTMPVEFRMEQLDKMYTGNSTFSIFAALSMIMFMAYIVSGVLQVRSFYHKENPVHRRLFSVFLLFASWFVLIFIKIFAMYIGKLEVWRWVNTLFAAEIAILYFLIQKYPFLLNYASLTKTKPKGSKKKILNTVDREMLSQELEIMMNEEKLFCDEDLSLSRLAHALEITSHQLSAFLNEAYDKNFNLFINEYRVRHALSILENDPKASTLSVAFASGFNSYSTFYAACKKITGHTPAVCKSRKTKAQ